MQSLYYRRGFSLVELSIVLVILGLLVGGILAGQSLIRASELRSVTTQFNQYQTAINTFRDKYFAFPGDMANAINVWGAAHATPATCFTTASTSALTCNGNGDGMIAASTGSDESFRFWQQLANAGLIEGTYSGVATVAGLAAIASNSPAGKLQTSLWYMAYYAPATSAVYVFDGQYGNALLVGGLRANTAPMTYIFKPQELWNIDTKMDDGKPATGGVAIRVLTGDGVGICTDTTTTSNKAANYLLTSNDFACNPLFRNLF